MPEGEPKRTPPESQPRFTATLARTYHYTVRDNACGVMKNDTRLKETSKAFLILEMYVRIGRDTDNTKPEM